MNLCGGSIIDKRRVLSAAHCFEHNKFYYVSHPEILRVVAGNLRSGLTHSGDTETNIISQWRNIDKIIVHNNFYFPSFDIALVFVDKDWEFTGNINYINVAKRSMDYPPSCISAGFGRVGFRLRDAVSPVLLVARIHTITKWHCSKLWEMNMNRFVCSDSSLADVSRGDSGGPLACKNTLDPSETPGRDLLVGVVSGKNFDKTTLYTRVSEYHEWIDRNRSFVLSCEILWVIIPFLLIYVLFSYYFMQLEKYWLKSQNYC